MSPRTVMLSASAALACSLFSGCASERNRPAEQITRARTVVEQADKAGAQRYAAADLQRAHDELNSAERAADNRKYDEARRLAEEAAADADLANARTGAGEAQRSAQELRQSIDTLRQESGRSSKDSGESR